MRKRLLLLLGVVLLLAVSGLAGVLLGPTSDSPVSRARCERVQVGMTAEHVEALLGGGPGDYRTGEVELDLRELDDGFHSVMTSMEVLLGERRFRHEWWQGDHGSFWVCFDEQNRVVTCKLTPGRRLTVLDKVRAWLGL